MNCQGVTLMHQTRVTISNLIQFQLELSNSMTGTVNQEYKIIIKRKS